MKPLSSAWPLLLSFLLFTFHFLLIQTSANCHPDDENALLAFKSQIRGNAKVSAWKPNTNCCNWFGISCNNANGRVQGINLPNCNLSGRLHQKLGSLSSLETFNVEGNKLNGDVPDMFSTLPNLSQLDLAHNRFSGIIPRSIANLTGLNELILTNNLFRGTIPYGICNLVRLYTLKLDHNRLSGRIHDFFTSFTQLDTIDLSYNKLHCKIPASISSLVTNLFYLNLGHNTIFGDIPSFLGNFNGAYLDLSWNHLTGVIPQSFFHETEEINLSHNFLHGPLPSLNMHYTESLDLSYNLFQMGKIPDWVTFSDTLININLAKCGIKMKLDDWMPQSPFGYEIFIDFSDNEISGSPVKLLKELDGLVSFKASNNQLKFDMGELKIIENSIEELDLSRNWIYGKVPASVAGIKKLNVSHNDNLCGSPQPPCTV